MDATTPPYELPEEGPQPFLRLPWAIGALAALMLGIEAVLSLMPGQADRILFNYGFVPARYSSSFLAAHGIDGGTLLERVLPFFTYMFLHAGWMHVEVNTVWLLAFGTAVVRRFGNARFFLFFILCGVAGAALHLALNWQAVAPVVGASAAISAARSPGLMRVVPPKIRASNRALRSSSTGAAAPSAAQRDRSWA